MTTAVGFDVVPLAGHIGAEIRGVDLRGPLEPVVVEEIRRALHANKVIFFRDQEIGHAEQIAFARHFGKVTPAHPHEENPPEGFPEILPIDNRRYENTLGRKRSSYDHSWHTDVTALVNPPAASILRAHILPPYGGDTAWTNLVAAYENLPQELRDFVDTLDIKHQFATKAAGRSGGSVPARRWVRCPVYRASRRGGLADVPGQSAVLARGGRRDAHRPRRRVALAAQERRGRRSRKYTSDTGAYGSGQALLCPGYADACAPGSGHVDTRRSRTTTGEDPNDPQ